MTSLCNIDFLVFYKRKIEGKEEPQDNELHGVCRQVIEIKEEKHMGRGGGGSFGGGGRSGGGGSFGSRGGGGGSFGRSGGSFGGSRSGGSFGGSGRSGGGGSFGRSGGSFGGGSRPGGSFGGGPRPGGSFGGGPRPGGFGGPGPMGGGFGGPGPMGGPGRPPRRGYRGGCLGSMLFIPVAFFAFFFLLVAIGTASMNSDFGSSSSSASETKSTIVREKLNTGDAWNSDCVDDEIGWLNSESATAKGLKEFFEDTGVQPYIYLAKYDASINVGGDGAEDAEEEVAQNYYEENIKAENGLLLVYFPASEEDVQTQDGSGEVYYWMGNQTGKVMDDQAVDIWFEQLNSAWHDYSLESWDEVFDTAFTNTGNAIMHVSTTTKDIVKWVVAGVVVLGAGGVAIVLVKQKNKRKKEEEEERERILNTPIDDLIKDEADKKADETTEKYL